MDDFNALFPSNKKPQHYGKNKRKKRRERGREIIISMALQTKSFHFHRFLLEIQASTVGKGWIRAPATARAFASKTHKNPRTDWKTKALSLSFSPSPSAILRDKFSVSNACTVKTFAQRGRWGWAPTATSEGSAPTPNRPRSTRLATPPFRKVSAAASLPDSGQRARAGAGESRGGHRPRRGSSSRGGGDPGRARGQTGPERRRGAWPPVGLAEPGARGNPTRCGCETRGGAAAAGERLRGVRSLTAKSGLWLSLCDTARITPARQPRQQRPLSPRSGCASSPTARHRNRFPTSSGRVSTAIAVAAEVAAASSAARKSPKPRSYRPPMLRTADLGKAAAPQASAGSGAHWTLCPEGHSDLGLSQSSALPWSSRLAASGCSSTNKRKKRTEISTRPSQAPRQRRPLPPPRRGQYYSASPSTSVIEGAPRVSFRRRGLGEGAAGEGRRNHRRRKVVPDAAAASAGPARIKKQEWGGRKECSPSET